MILHNFLNVSNTLNGNILLYTEKSSYFVKLKNELWYSFSHLVWNEKIFTCFSNIKFGPFKRLANNIMFLKFSMQPVAPFISLLNSNKNYKRLEFVYIIIQLLRNQVKLLLLNVWMFFHYHQKLKLNYLGIFILYYWIIYSFI